MLVKASFKIEERSQIVENISWRFSKEIWGSLRRGEVDVFVAAFEIAAAKVVGRGRRTSVAEKRPLRTWRTRTGVSKLDDIGRSLANIGSC